MTAVPNIDFPSLQRPIIVATESEPQADIDMHYTIARLEPETIDKIASATADIVIERLIGRQWK